MKNIIILTLILSYSVCLHSQNMNDSIVTNLNSQLRSLLIEDTLAYQQFLMVKRVLCRDNYKDINESRSGKNKKFIIQNANRLYDKLREKGYLFFIVIDKNKLFDIIEKKCNQEMVNCRNNLSDDYLFLDDQILISEAVSCPSSYNRQIYLDIVSDYKNYYSLYDYRNIWENDKIFIEQIIKNYPYISYMWYRQTPIDDVVLPCPN